MIAIEPDVGIDLRRRRLRYRMWHRGTREMDLIMGRFVDAEIGDINEIELTELERLAEMPDPDLYGWIVGGEPVPAACDGAALRRLRDFHRTKAPE
jgi:antitoxin CptB